MIIFRRIMLRGYGKVSLDLGMFVIKVFLSKSLEKRIYLI